ncbi:MAG: uracil-DNA glycosylase [Bacteroidetes bacterium]|jgi:uracil-DNA glycosylase|nr:uracil-DNA glycosylase [Bacteroidota bacterium]
MVNKPDIHESWYQVLKPEFEAPYFAKLKEFLKEEMKQHRIFPPANRIFHAFNTTPLAAVKVVILGQDPYHGLGQAHGLAFSVPDGVKPPPSLQNIYKELASDIGFRIPKSGNLEQWAQEGVLLLNTVLTVRESTASSHAGKGWELFTDAAISAISENRAGVVFMLWGKHAISKEKLINQERHFILKSVHPSPLSAHRGFFGCKHFSKANEYLKKIGFLTVDWQLRTH